MKSEFDIELNTLYIGEKRRVVTVGLNGKDEADRFIRKLIRKDPDSWNQIATRIVSISNYDRYENQTTFRSVGNGIFEFKRPGTRLYSFYDEIGGELQLILCTNGGGKGTKKEQQADIEKAKQIRKRYMEMKTKPDTRFRLNQDPML